jgi:hypothetical protein
LKTHAFPNLFDHSVAHAQLVAIVEATFAATLHSGHLQADCAPRHEWTPEG